MTTTLADISVSTPTLIDELAYLKVIAEYRLCKLLEREKKICVVQAHRRVAYSLSNADFAAIINKLVDCGFCTRSTSVRNSEVLNLVEHTSGLLALDAKVVRQQRVQELRQSAEAATKVAGSIFDTRSEQEIEDLNLPMAELRRRAAGNFSGSDF